MTTRKTFQFKFSRLFSKNRHPGKLHRTFSPQRLERLFPLKKVINGIIFAPQLVVKWHSHCAVKMTSVRAGASLVRIGKVSSSS